MVSLERKTKETDIALELTLQGEGRSDVQTGVGFLDHMLESLAKHSGMDLKIRCQGDLHVDYHHTVEDVGIVLGQALKQAIYPVGQIERFGDSVIVMDETAIECALDLSNRPFLVFEIPLDGKVGEMDCELTEEFFRAVAFNASITLHLILKRGQNRHHIIEAAFKSFAVALRRSLGVRTSGGIPSTKGVL